MHVLLLSTYSVLRRRLLGDSWWCCHGFGCWCCIEVSGQCQIRASPLLVEEYWHLQASQWPTLTESEKYFLFAWGPCPLRGHVVSIFRTLGKKSNKSEKAALWQRIFKLIWPSDLHPVALYFPCPDTDFGDALKSPDFNLFLARARANQECTFFSRVAIRRGSADTS